MPTAPPLSAVFSATVASLLLATAAHAASPGEPNSALVQTAYSAPAPTSESAAQNTAPVQRVRQPVDGANELIDVSPFPLLLLGCAAIGIALFRRTKYTD